MNVLPFDKHILLLPQDSTGTKYDGYIFVKDKEYRLRLVLGLEKSLRNARFECEWDLKNLIEGHEQILEKRLQQSSNLQVFLSELRAVVESVLDVEDATCQQTISNSDSFNKIISDIREIGWNNFVDTNEEFNTVKMMARDAADRCHTITFHLDNQFPASRPSCLVDLPVPFNFVWPKKNGSLQSIYNQFVQALASYQQFWNNMDEIDSSCWVLEPEHKTRGCNFRRIVLGKNASLHVILLPNQSNFFPECRFLGSDRVIAPLRDKLDPQNSWDESVSVLVNMKTILQIEFPTLESKNREEDFSMDCGICYAFRLKDEIPERSCDDERCGQIYHISCLVEWLRSLPNCRQSFNVIFGECPYCNKPLSVKISNATRR